MYETRIQLVPLLLLSKLPMSYLNFPFSVNFLFQKLILLRDQLSHRLDLISGPFLSCVTST